MGIKKIARPMNRAKKSFIEWMKNNNATSIDGLNDPCSDHEWDYYVMISCFIDDRLYTVSFMVWQGREAIDYTDEENSYRNMTIDEFLLLIDTK